MDSYDFHGLETLQCMLERRKGGETGVTWLQAYRGDKFWEALRDGVWSKRLFDAALCRSHTLTPARPGFNDIFPSFGRYAAVGERSGRLSLSACRRAAGTMILMSGLIRDFNFAATLDGRASRFPRRCICPMPDGRTTLANFFSPLVNNMEQMFLTGKPPYPLERTLLTTGLTAAGVDSLLRGADAIQDASSCDSYQPTLNPHFGEPK